MYLSRQEFEEKFPLLPSKSEFIIGRHRDCDLRFASKHVSRFHCKLLRNTLHSFIVINLTDTNSTYVDDNVLDKKDRCAILKVGSLLSLGIPFVNMGNRNEHFIFLKLLVEDIPDKLPSTLCESKENIKKLLKESFCGKGSNSMYNAGAYNGHKTVNKGLSIGLSCLKYERVTHEDDEDLNWRKRYLVYDSKKETDDAIDYECDLITNNCNNLTSFSANQSTKSLDNFARSSENHSKTPLDITLGSPSHNSCSSDCNVVHDSFLRNQPSTSSNGNDFVAANSSLMVSPPDIAMTLIQQCKKEKKFRDAFSKILETTVYNSFDHQQNKQEIWTTIDTETKRGMHLSYKSSSSNNEGTCTVNKMTVPCDQFENPIVISDSDSDADILIDEKPSPSCGENNSNFDVNMIIASSTSEKKSALTTVSDKVKIKTVSSVMTHQCFSSPEQLFESFSDSTLINKSSLSVTPSDIDLAKIPVEVIRDCLNVRPIKTEEEVESQTQENMKFSLRKNSGTNAVKVESDEEIDICFENLMLHDPNPQSVDVSNYKNLKLNDVADLKFDKILKSDNVISGDVTSKSIVNQLISSARNKKLLVKLDNIEKHIEGDAENWDVFSFSSLSSQPNSKTSISNCHDEIRQTSCENDPVSGKSSKYKRKKRKKKEKNDSDSDVEISKRAKKKKFARIVFSSSDDEKAEIKISAGSKNNSPKQSVNVDASKLNEQCRKRLLCNDEGKDQTSSSLKKSKTVNDVVRKDFDSNSDTKTFDIDGDSGSDQQIPIKDSTCQKVPLQTISGSLMELNVCADEMVKCKKDNAKLKLIATNVISNGNIAPRNDSQFSQIVTHPDIASSHDNVLQKISCNLLPNSCFSNNVLNSNVSTEICSSNNDVPAKSCFSNDKVHTKTGFSVGNNNSKMNSSEIKNISRISSSDDTASTKISSTNDQANVIIHSFHDEVDTKSSSSIDKVFIEISSANFNLSSKIRSASDEGFIKGSSVNNTVFTEIISPQPKMYTHASFSDNEFCAETNLSFDNVPGKLNHFVKLVPKTLNSPKPLVAKLFENVVDSSTWEDDMLPDLDELPQQNTYNISKHSINLQSQLSNIDCIEHCSKIMVTDSLQMQEMLTILDSNSSKNLSTTSNLTENTAEATGNQINSPKDRSDTKTYGDQSLLVQTTALHVESSSNVDTKIKDEKGDDDGNVIYSQLDDCIYLSSDEEEQISLSQEPSGQIISDADLDPLPSCPEFGLDDLFGDLCVRQTEDLCNTEQNGKVLDDSDGLAFTSTTVATDDNFGELEDDEQWFPDLSQSFYEDEVLVDESNESEDSKENVPKTVACKKVHELNWSNKQDQERLVAKELDIFSFVKSVSKSDVNHNETESSKFCEKLSSNKTMLSCADNSDEQRSASDIKLDLPIKTLALSSDNALEGSDDELPDLDISVSTISKRPKQISSTPTTIEDKKIKPNLKKCVEKFDSGLETIIQKVQKNKFQEKNAMLTKAVVPISRKKNHPSYNDATREVRNKLDIAACVSQRKSKENKKRTSSSSLRCSLTKSFNLKGANVTKERKRKNTELSGCSKMVSSPTTSTPSPPSFRNLLKVDHKIDLNKVKLNENISIIKRPQKTTEKLTGIAKITKKSRSFALTEIDFVSNSDAQKLRHKYNKKTKIVGENKNELEITNGGKGKCEDRKSLSHATTTTSIKEYNVFKSCETSEKLTPKEKSSNSIEVSNISSSLLNVTDELWIEVIGSLVNDLLDHFCGEFMNFSLTKENSSANVENLKLTKAGSEVKCLNREFAIINLKNSATTSVSSNSAVCLSETPVVDSSETCKTTLNGILRLPENKLMTRKTVRFPLEKEEFEKVQLISPRKDRSKMGPMIVCNREKRLGIQIAPLPHISSKNISVSLNVKPFYLNRYYMIYKVCSWNYDWLKQYELSQRLNSNAHPPPLLGAKGVLFPTLILYENYKDYHDVFSGLLFYEVWEAIFKNWQRFHYSSVWWRCEVDVVKMNYLPDNVKGRDTCDIAYNFTYIKVVTLVSHNQEHQGIYPRQGSLIAVKVPLQQKSTVMLAYVEHQMRYTRPVVSKELRQAIPNASSTLVLTLLASKRCASQLSQGQIISVNTLAYFKPHIRVYEGLNRLVTSPLCSHVLKPTISCLSPPSKVPQYVVPEMLLNTSQENAVTRVAAAVLCDPVPRISLIHGPPGTGKTSTIIALIAQIIRRARENNLRSRILLCAPSNAVVDELTMRLLQFPVASENPLRANVVRVGAVDRQNVNSASLKNAYLDSLVDRRLQHLMKTPRDERSRVELSRLKAMVETARQEMMAEKDASKHKWLQERVVMLTKKATQFERDCKPNYSFSDLSELKANVQKEVLLRADVVTSTLGSSSNEVLSSILHNEVSVCIVDEAGQCKEMETWLPLLTGVCKMVLVGDHHQLPPTVLSRLAHGKNLRQSLFERLHHHFVIELNRPELVHTLNIQYRMHPFIASFPASHFYRGELHSTTDLFHSRTSPLHPYTVFDISDGEEISDNQQGDVHNLREAQTLLAVITAIADVIKNYSIGIITPYQKQKDVLKRTLGTVIAKFNVTINTIDAFQGQERDIILFSCVRAVARGAPTGIGFLSQHQRLNVALTRAKFCFVMVGSLRYLALKDSNTWGALVEDAIERTRLHTLRGPECTDKELLKKILLI